MGAVRCCVFFCLHRVASPTGQALQGSKLSRRQHVIRVHMVDRRDNFKCGPCACFVLFPSLLLFCFRLPLTKAKKVKCGMWNEQLKKRKSADPHVAEYSRQSSRMGAQPSPSHVRFYAVTPHTKKQSRFSLASQYYPIAIVTPSLVC